MLVSDIILDVRRDIVEPIPTFWNNAELISYINRAEMLFCDAARELIVGRATLDTVIGQSEYPLPANFLSSKMVFYNTAVSPASPSWRRLQSTSVEKQAQENPNFLSTATDTFGDPTKCFIWGDSIFLSPTPSVAGSGNIVMFFNAKPIAVSQLTDELNVSDQFREAIGGFVRWKAWAKEQDKAKADEGKADFLTGIAQARRDVKKKQLDRRNRVDIDSQVPFSPSGNLVQGFDPF